MTIVKIEQFNAVTNLLELLISLNLPRSESVQEDFQLGEGQDWIVCDYCAEIKADCHCDDESQHGRYYAEYDDESSFE